MHSRANSSTAEQQTLSPGFKPKSLSDLSSGRTCLNWHNPTAVWIPRVSTRPYVSVRFSLDLCSTRQVHQEERLVGNAEPQECCNMLGHAGPCWFIVMSPDQILDLPGSSKNNAIKHQTSNIAPLSIYLPPAPLLSMLLACCRPLKQKMIVFFCLSLNTQLSNATLKLGARGGSYPRMAFFFYSVC